MPNYRSLFILVFVLFIISCQTGNNPSEILKSNKEFNSVRGYISYLKELKKDDHLKSFTFVQKSIRYKDSSAVDTSIWHEAIEYPDKFRIDFGDLKEGNTNLYRADSIYMYRQGELKQSIASKQELLLMEGGIYFYTLDSILQDLADFSIDTSVFTKTTYLDRKVYVLGAESWEEEVPQIWIDAEEHHNIRRKTLQADDILYSVEYYNHKKFDGYWIETGVDFFSPSGELLQKEIYTNVKANPKLDPLVFDPIHSPSNHWLD